MTLRMRMSGVRRVLLVSGLSLLAYCGYVVADAWWFQREANAAWEAAAAPVAAVSARRPVDRSVDRTKVVGRLAISRLDLSVMVLEGTSAKTLRRAAGHIAGTALPGQPGNTGISAHRDTFFYPLRNIRTDDLVSVTTGAGEFRYRVVSITVVPPDDTGVLAVTEAEVLTLVTCYPFTFIGSAPERFIVLAKRVI